MKAKNRKKLTLAKETLKLLNTNDLARVQSGSDTLPTLDPICIPPPVPLTTGSDSL